MSEEERGPCGRMSGLPLVLVHGGTVGRRQQPLHQIQAGVKEAASRGYQALLGSRCVLTAVEAAISALESDPTFNAGRGSALNLAGKVEMGASIMEGSQMRAGGVALLDCMINPIILARKLLDLGEYSFLAGEGARTFAQEVCPPIVSQEELILPNMQEALEEFKCSKMGQKASVPEWQDTVGCVVVDWHGQVASGCSSGGRTGKPVDRIGDAPFPGSGHYCDDNIGAVSVCGPGESSFQYNLSHRIINNMKSCMSPEDAAARELCILGRKYGKPAAAIAVNGKGDTGVAFTTETFAWACQLAKEVHYGYLPGQHIIDLQPDQTS